MGLMFFVRNNEVATHLVIISLTLKAGSRLIQASIVILRCMHIRKNVNVLENECSVDSKQIFSCEQLLFVYFEHWSQIFLCVMTSICLLWSFQ